MSSPLPKPPRLCAPAPSNGRRTRPRRSGRPLRMSPLPNRLTSLAATCADAESCKRHQASSHRGPLQAVTPSRTRPALRQPFARRRQAAFTPLGGLLQPIGPTRRPSRRSTAPASSASGRVAAGRRSWRSLPGGRRGRCCHQLFPSPGGRYTARGSCRPLFITDCWRLEAARTPATHSQPEPVGSLPFRPDRQRHPRYEGFHVDTAGNTPF